MKRKKSFLTLLMACVVVVLFCLAGTTIAGPGPTPGGEKDDKVIGPQVKGVLIAGWRENYVGATIGTVEVFLLLDSNLYVGVISIDNPEGVFQVPETGFLGTIPIDITEWALPQRIATDYKMGDNTSPVIWEEKDVSNLVVIESIPLDKKLFEDQKLSYRHVIHCDVKISFWVSE